MLILVIIHLFDESNGKKISEEKEREEESDD